MDPRVNLRSRLAGFWFSRYPGGKAFSVVCYGCGRSVRAGKWTYRLFRERPRMVPPSRLNREVVGYLCRKCRQALGPAKGYFTQIG